MKKARLMLVLYSTQRDKRQVVGATLRGAIAASCFAWHKPQQHRQAYELYSALVVLLHIDVFTKVILVVITLNPDRGLKGNLTVILTLHRQMFVGWQSDG